MYLISQHIRLAVPVTHSQPLDFKLDVWHISHVHNVPRALLYLFPAVWVSGSDTISSSVPLLVDQSLQKVQLSANSI